MRWEALTSPDFARAVRETGVCILPMGVLEKHGEHCPLGTDYLIAHDVATLAAEVEPAVVFPQFYFGQINEARCYPGTVAIRLALLAELVEATLDEIGRNGFRKIIIYSWHGGNPNLVGQLLKQHLWQEKPYTLYSVHRIASFETPERREERMKLLESGRGGHGGEYETSILLAQHPEMVKMETIPDEPSESLARLKHLRGMATPMNWYSMYPEHYSGDARPSTAEKGKRFMQLVVETLVEYIRAVKADTVEPMLQKEFFKRVDELGRSGKG